MDRRTIVMAGFGTLLLKPARATPQALQAAIAAFTNGRTPRDGRVQLEISPLVENGNAVPVSVAVQSPMTVADHVQRIAVFTSSNPQPEVAVFHLGPRNGSAAVATRMRLATSQTVLALAVMNDGSVWQNRADVLVTLAACVEG
ncbi:MAG TPA: SoxY-related AACIE arm protein [Rubrivivax sp.]|nr:SoxY-related AACIE arm protein [Rubrivivax sp.]